MMVAQGQAADGQPDCSHIIGEAVSADERNRSPTFGRRKTKFFQLAWAWKTEFYKSLAVYIFSSLMGASKESGGAGLDG